jgi:hypothetical protein
MIDPGGRYNEAGEVCGGKERERGGEQAPIGESSKTKTTWTELLRSN